MQFNLRIIIGLAALIFIVGGFSYLRHSKVSDEGGKSIQETSMSAQSKIILDENGKDTQKSSINLQKDTKSIIESWSQKALNGYQISEIQTQQDEGIETSSLQFLKGDASKEGVEIQGAVVMISGILKGNIKKTSDIASILDELAKTSSNCIKDFQQSLGHKILTETQSTTCVEGNILYALFISGPSTILSEGETFEKFLAQLREELQQQSPSLIPEFKNKSEEILRFFNLKSNNLNLPIDCGFDLDCFIDAAQSCTKAVFSRSLDFSTLESDETIEELYTILGTVDRKCSLRLATSLSGVPEVNSTGAYQARECEFEIDKLVSSLKKAKTGIFFPNGATCHGPGETLPLISKISDLPIASNLPSGWLVDTNQIHFGSFVSNQNKKHEGFIAIRSLTLINNNTNILDSSDAPDRFASIMITEYDSESNARKFYDSSNASVFDVNNTHRVLQPDVETSIAGVATCRSDPINGIKLEVQCYKGPYYFLILRDENRGSLSSQEHKNEGLNLIRSITHAIGQ